MDQPEIALTGRAPVSPCDFYVVKEFTAGIEAFAGNFELVVSGSGGSVGYAVKAKLTQTQTANRAINGLMAAGTFELNLGACVDAWASFGVVELRFDNSGLAAIGNTEHGGFILLREKSTTQKCQNFLASPDVEVSASGTEDIFSSTGGERTHSHSLRIKFKGVPYWIMCTSTAP